MHDPRRCDGRNAGRPRRWVAGESAEGGPRQGFEAHDDVGLRPAENERRAPRDEPGRGATTRKDCGVARDRLVHGLEGREEVDQGEA